MNDDYIEEYERYLKFDRRYSNNTINSYILDIDLFKDYIKKDLLDITHEDINKYLKAISEKSTKTIAHSISSLKSFYKYYDMNEKIKANPTKGIKSPKVEKTLPVVLSPEEVLKILDINVNSPYDARNKAIFELLYSSGIRISELTNLELANVDLDENLIKIMGKGSKERIIPIGDYAKEAISNYINNYRCLINKKNMSYLFLNNLGERLSRQYIFKLLKNECIKKGISKNVSPHTLRHTYATHLLKNGADLRIIQELLGHENLSTTQIYTHLDKDTLHNDYNEFFPR